MITVMAAWLMFSKDFPTTRQPHFKWTDGAVCPMVIDVVTHKFRYAHACASKEKNTVWINRKFWKESSDWQKLKVMYHEIGHIRGLGHDESYSNIMDTNINTPNSVNWDVLVDDLKGKI